MRDRAVDLLRRFTPMSARSWDWDILMSGPGRPQRWHEMEDQHRVLIIAAPGAGKTFEAETRARKIRERSKKGFFIRIEKIDNHFESAFEVGSAEEFAAWLVSDEEAWFFLDSVDEAQLETPRALEDAVRIFGARIHSARERAHIFITSREDAWRALPDQTLIEQFLPYGEATAKPEDGETEEKREPTLKLFRMAGLNEDEIRLFATHYGVGDTVAFVDAVKRRNLMTLAECPFDLKALIQVWNADHTLGDRFEVLQRMIALQLEPLSAASAKVRIDCARVRAAVRLLAGTVLLSGKAIICLPDGIHSPDRIDPRAMLPDWSEIEIDALLRTGIFDDIVYTSVRFRHREIRELLCAEWAHDLLDGPGGRARVEDLFFRDRYGEEVVVPRTRPILPWLILLDEDVRDKALAIAPDIASEGGDPSRLPLELRRTMLKDLVEQIVAERV